MSPEVWRRFTASSLFWPVVALVALLVFDAVAVPGFFSLRIQDGHLYGSLVDILKNGAPTAIIALGMTLVIATRGIDLSVGATVAISGRGGLRVDRGGPDPTSASAAIVGDAAGAGPLGRARPLERVPGRGAGHPADHRHAGAHDRGPRHRPADHRRADHHRGQPAVRPARRRVPARPAGLGGAGRGAVRARRRRHPAHRAGHAHRGRGDQPDRRAPGGHPGARASPWPSTSSSRCAPASPG